MFSKSLKKNLIVFQFFWKKNVLSAEGNSIFFYINNFSFFEEEVCGGGVESISPRRKAFKIFNSKFGVVILNYGRYG